MNKIYMPEGSIVVLKEKKDALLMILKSDINAKNVHKDYLCSIPSADEESLKLIYINESEIESVIFLGYQH